MFFGKKESWICLGLTFGLQNLIEAFVGYSGLEFSSRELNQ